MFGKFKELVGGGAKRMTGRTDLLEATAAAVALVASADGEIEDSEVEVGVERLLTHTTLSAAFKQTEIEAVANKMLNRAKQGLTGRVGLKKEVEQATAKSTSDDLEMILCIAIDVARADGEIEPQEVKVLGDIANILRLDLRSYLNA